MMVRGVAVSPGVAVATAYCMDDALVQYRQEHVGPADVEWELACFDRACESAALDIRAMIEKVSFEVGERESAIFQSHLLMVRDRTFIGKVKQRIVEASATAILALDGVLEEYEALFEKIDDPYLRERLVDLRDVVSRIESHLLEESIAESMGQHNGPIIVVASELLPSQTVGFGSRSVVGIATARGGQTGHAAIIARSLGIPSLSGIGNLTRIVRTGDLLALDGREGILIVNPGPEVEAAYRKLEREYFDLKDELIENRDVPAVTRDGFDIEILANVNNVSDAQAACDMGASAVGLFRTEYLFLSRHVIPDEEEQYEVYRQVVEACPNRRLTIRTLDLGGDKTVPYLGNHREANPFMGWRSIRLSIEHPDLFRKQIRAILRASVHGQIQVLFPMITNVEELRRVKRMYCQARRQLQDAGVPFDPTVRLGMMVEVPAAAISIDDLLPHVDFVSIGTNDLVQYLLAADRDNPKVAHLCDPLSPAVLRLLRSTIEACDAHGIPVTVCGEMAGMPRCVLALLAFGLRRFSMSPAFVPIIKDLVNSVDSGDLARLGPILVQKKSSKLVRTYLGHLLERIHPRLASIEFA